jgi:hypothetical protein
MIQVAHNFYASDLVVLPYSVNRNKAIEVVEAGM